MAAPKLPPRPTRPKLPGYHPAPKPKAPTFKVPKTFGFGQQTFPSPSKPPAAPKPPAAASTPAASAPVASAPTSAALPPDPSYEGTVGALGRQRDTTLSGLAGQRTSGLLNYGYNEAAGGALSFDPTNPYSQAAQMKKRYDEAQTGAANTMAARGNLYAGSNQQQQDIIGRQRGASNDQLMKSLIQFLAGNTGARSKAQTDYELGVAGAESDRLGRAASNPLYSPTGDEPAAGSPAANAGGPVGYSGAKGLVGGKYIDASGGVHAVQTKGGKKYYLAGSGKWVAI